MLGGKSRRFFILVDTNPTSVQNMLLGLEMADWVDQSFVKVHFHRTTTEYSNKIVDKEAERIAMREQFLKDNQERPNENNYEFKRRDRNDKAPNIVEINDQQKKKRLKTKWPSYFFGFENVYLEVDVKTLMFLELFKIYKLRVLFKV